MFKSFRLGLVAFAAIGALASCNNDANENVPDAARDAVETTTDAAVTGANAMAEGAEGSMEAVPSGPLTEMSFTESEFDFGTVAEGEKVKHTYQFKNTGSEPLILSNATGSCGCTVPQWPREPIAPGATGEILVEFNSQGKPGDRNQKVTITANTNPAQTVIALKGKVEAAAQPAG